MRTWSTDLGGLVTRVLTAGLVAGATVLVLPPAQVEAATTAPATSFSYTSAVGDPVGGGLSETLKKSAAVTFTMLSGNRKELDLDINVVDTGRRFSIRLQPGRGDQLRPGVFANAERAFYPSGRAPGLDVSGQRGCNEVYGSFEIHQIAFTAESQIKMLEATFAQRCGPTAPQLTGRLLLNALPLSYAYSSEPNDFVGQGKSGSYTGAKSIIVPATLGTDLAVNVSGKRDDWSLILGGPGNTRLRAGTFTTSRFGSATTAKLDVTANSRGCNETAGTLKVHSVWWRTDGKVGGLHATFTQRCDGMAGQLSGTLRYLA